MEGREVFDSIVDPFTSMIWRLAIGLFVLGLLVLASPMLMENLNRTVNKMFRSMTRPPRGGRW